MPRFHVQRSIEIAAPPKVAYEKVVDYGAWTKWSPWLCVEPTAKVTVTDNSNSVGSVYAWDGQLVGAGEIEHQQLEPGRRIEDEIRFTKPFKSKSAVRFEFAPSGEGTQVTWHMDGSMPWFLFWMVSSMQAYIGMDYERGLKMLKDLVEKGKVDAKTKIIGPQQIGPLSLIGVRKACAIQEIGSSMTDAIGQLEPLCQQLGVPADSTLASVYHVFDMKKQSCEYTVGKLVEAGQFQAQSPLETWSIPTEINALCVEHWGDYNHLGNSWYAANMFARAKKLKQSRLACFEIYETKPEAAPMDQWCTKIYLPLK